MTSNINISPTQQLGQTAAILNNLGAERQQMDQMKLAEMARQKAQFQDLINKSFQPVMSQFAEDYNTKQNEFINNASELYKKSGGFLSMKDNMEINKLKQPLDEYVAYSNASRELYSNLVQKIESSSADKVDKTASLKRLNDAMTINENDDPRTLYDRLNGGGIIQEKIQPFDFIDLGTKAIKGAVFEIPTNDERRVKNGQEVDLNVDKLDANIESLYIQNKEKADALGYDKETFTDLVKRSSPEYMKYQNYKKSSGSSGGKKLLEIVKKEKLPSFGFNSEEYVLPKKFEVSVSGNILKDDGKGGFVTETIAGDRAGMGHITDIVTRNGKKYAKIQINSKSSGGGDAGYDYNPETQSFTPRIGNGAKKEEMDAKDFTIYKPLSEYKDQLSSVYNMSIFNENTDSGNFWGSLVPVSVETKK